jgi:hypothetical protein
MSKSVVLAVALVAGSQLANAAQSSGSIPGMVGAGLENRCAAGEKKGGLGGILKKIPRIDFPGGGNKDDDASSGLAAKANKVLGEAMPESAICRSRSQEERLLLTGLMLDSAALSAARGLDEAQQALGIKRTFENEIALLERATQGFGSGGDNVSVTTIESASDQAHGLVTLLEERKAAGTLDEKANAHLAEARGHLNEVGYFAVSFGAGMYLVTEFHKNSGATSMQQVMAVLGSPRIGFRSDFLARVGQRAASLPETAMKTVELNDAISKVVATPEAPKKGQERARKAADQAAERIRDGLKDETLTPV